MQLEALLPSTGRGLPVTGLVGEGDIPVALASGVDGARPFPRVVDVCWAPGFAADPCGGRLSFRGVRLSVGSSANGVARTLVIVGLCIRLLLAPSICEPGLPLRMS